ncbi:MAG TPA: hypothetical protein ENJ44_00565 [Oceanospirillales bacterium]|nr:hypothetical protein [Oceanospirillales bacterium]
MFLKNIVLTLMLSFGLFYNTPSFAKNSGLQNAIVVVNDIANLAEEFNLTAEQKKEIKAVLFEYLPQMAVKANSMLSNRQELLGQSLGNDKIDENFLTEIANKQAQLLKSLIIQKEHMKKDLRMILTDEQKGFVDAIIDAIIQRRMNHFS